LNDELAKVKLTFGELRTGRGLRCGRDGEFLLLVARLLSGNQIIVALQQLCRLRKLLSYFGEPSPKLLQANFIIWFVDEVVGVIPVFRSCFNLRSDPILSLYHVDSIIIRLFNGKTGLPKSSSRYRIL
jgi:hypothetical protein